jgi:hypothetical protein
LYSLILFLSSCQKKESFEDIREAKTKMEITLNNKLYGINSLDSDVEEYYVVKSVNLENDTSINFILYNYKVKTVEYKGFNQYYINLDQVTTLLTINDNLINKIKKLKSSVDYYNFLNDILVINDITSFDSTVNLLTNHIQISYVVSSIYSIYIPFEINIIKLIALTDKEFLSDENAYLLQTTESLTSNTITYRLIYYFRNKTYLIELSGDKFEIKPNLFQLYITYNKQKHKYILDSDNALFLKDNNYKYTSIQLKNTNNDLLLKLCASIEINNKEYYQA